MFFVFLGYCHAGYGNAGHVEKSLSLGCLRELRYTPLW
jgi:hypothetical protein